MSPSDDPALSEDPDEPLESESIAPARTPAPLPGFAPRPKDETPAAAARHTHTPEPDVVVTVFEPRSNRLAVASVVLAALGLVVPFVASGLALLAGVVARNRALASGGAMSGSRIATAGALLGVAGLLWGFALVPILESLGVDNPLRGGTPAPARLAQSDAVHISQAIERCAVSAPDGSYASCTTERILKDPKLPAVPRQHLMAGCTTATGACISLKPGARGSGSYKVQTNVPIGRASAHFFLSRANTGTAQRTCEATAPSAKSACPKGTW